MGILMGILAGIYARTIITYLIAFVKNASKSDVLEAYLLGFLRTRLTINSVSVKCTQGLCKCSIVLMS